MNAEETKQQAVVDAARRLVRLLDDPHPGLASWHIACETMYLELLKAAKS